MDVDTEPQPLDPTAATGEAEDTDDVPDPLEDALEAADQVKRPLGTH